MQSLSLWTTHVDHIATAPNAVQKGLDAKHRLLLALRFQAGSRIYKHWWRLGEASWGRGDRKLAVEAGAPC
jgi:hypothetical protein